MGKGLGTQHHILIWAVTVVLNSPPPPPPCNHSILNSPGMREFRFNLISDFFCFTKSHYQTFLQFECIEKHIFSGFSDYFRLFLTDTLTPLTLLGRNPRRWDDRMREPEVSERALVPSALHLIAARHGGTRVVLLAGVRRVRPEDVLRLQKTSGDAALAHVRQQQLLTREDVPSDVCGLTRPW